MYRASTSAVNACTDSAAVAHRPGKRRVSSVPECELEPARCLADSVEPLGRGEHRRRSQYRPQAPDRLLGLVDPGRVLGRAQLGQARAEVVEVSTAGRLRRQLADGGDRNRVADEPQLGDRATLVVDDEPARLSVRRLVGAQIEAKPGRRLGGDDSDQRLLLERERGSRRRDTLEIGFQTCSRAHRGEHRLASMADVLTPRRRHAQELFAPLGPTYDRYAGLLSLGQDPRWRAFLVSRVPAEPDDRVLDVATGTGAVAARLARVHGCAVVGVDQSTEMLATAHGRLARAELSGLVELVEGHADELPFEDATFDGLTFTYLLRYVDDPGSTLRELARVVRPGGTMAALEFGVPPRASPAAAWELYVRVGLPLAGRSISPGWREVAAFLGREHPRVLRSLSGRAPAGALAGSGLRRGATSPAQPGRGHRDLGPPGMSDPPGVLRAACGRLARLRHAPPSALHALASVLRRDRSGARRRSFSGRRLAAALAAFFLALGVGAHALDELNGRPLQTQIPARALVGLAAVSIAGAIAIGIASALAWTLWLLPFIAFGGFIVVAYNAELFGGWFHTDLWFALAWGAFPLLTGYFVMAEELRAEAALAAVFAALQSHAQRVLSTPVRFARRRVRSISGALELHDGSREPISAETLLRAPEQALQALAAATIALGVALVVLRL